LFFFFFFFFFFFGFFCYLVAAWAWGTERLRKRSQLAHTPRLLLAAVSCLLLYDVSHVVLISEFGASARFVGVRDPTVGSTDFC
jgi:hypothetical protein